MNVPILSPERVPMITVTSFKSQSLEVVDEATLAHHFLDLASSKVTGCGETTSHCFTLDEAFKLYQLSSVES
jgi:hypothetical protein